MGAAGRSGSQRPVSPLIPFDLPAAWSCRRSPPDPDRSPERLEADIGTAIPKSGLDAPPALHVRPTGAGQGEIARKAPLVGADTESGVGVLGQAEEHVAVMRAERVAAAVG